MGSGHSAQTTLSHGLKPPVHPALHGTYSSGTTTTVTSGSTLAEGGSSELTGLTRQLAINWVIFDKEFDLIAYNFISYLLQSPCEAGCDGDGTSSNVKVQRTRSGGCMHVTSGQGQPPWLRSPSTRDALQPAGASSLEAAGADDSISAPTATIDIGGSNATSACYNNSGPGISATLRAGVLGLDVVGVRRAIDVLAYIAAGCQSREDRINAAVALGECEAGASSRLPLGLLGSTMPGISATPHLAPHILVSTSTNEGSATWSAYSLGSRHFSQTTSASQSTNLAGATTQQQQQLLLQQHASRPTAPSKARPEASPSPARYHIAAAAQMAAPAAPQPPLVVPLHLSPLLHEHSYNAGLLLTVQAMPRVGFGDVSPALSRHPSTSLAYARASPSRSTTPKALTELSATHPTPPAAPSQSPFVAPQHPAAPPSNHNPRRLSGGALAPAPPPTTITAAAPTTTTATIMHSSATANASSNNTNNIDSKDNNNVMQAQLPGGGVVYYCTQPQSPKRNSALTVPSSSALATLFNDLTDDRGAGLRGMTTGDAIELLCTTFAHLHFTDVDVVNFIVAFVDTVYEVQARALAAAHKLAHPHRGGGGRLGGSSDNVLTTMTSASMSSRVHAMNASASQPQHQQPSYMGGSSRLVLLPYLERYVLPYYQHCLRVLAFASGCERGLPLLLMRQQLVAKASGSMHVYPASSTAARSTTTATEQGHAATTTSPRPSRSLVSSGNSLTSTPAGPAMPNTAPRDRSRESGSSVTSLPVPAARTTCGPGRGRADMRAATESCSTVVPSGGPTSVSAAAEGATPELLSTVLDESEGVVLTPSVSLLSNPLGPSSSRMQCSQAHQYFREQCPTLIDYAASATMFSSAGGGAGPAGKSSGTIGNMSSSAATTMIGSSTARMAGGRSSGAVGASGSGISSTSSSTAASSGYGYNHQYSAGAARYRAEMLSMKSDYVLHYAELMDEQCIQASLSLSSLSPSSSTTVQGAVNSYGDAFACMSGEPLWPLASRLLMLRGQYLYLYDAVATTIGALGGSFNLTTGGGGAGNNGVLGREMNSPIALLSLSNAMESDFRIIGEVDETEIVHVGPSRTVRGQRTSGDEVAAAALARTAAAGQSGHFVVPSSASSCGSNVTTLTTSQRGAFFFRGSSNEDVHVYRMEHRQHGIFLLCLPVGLTPSHYENAGQAAAVNVAWSQYAAGSATRTASNSNNGVGSGADRMGNRNAEEGAGRPRQGVSRHGLTGTATPRTMSDATRDGGEFFYSPRMSEFAPVAANEVIALTVYPLRVYCKGVLHHLFFQSASARAEWRHRLTVLSTRTQSRAHLARLAAAPQCVEAFVRRRISFPVVPDAFDYLDMLGVGTFGRVLLVRHKLTGRLFALKIIRKTGFHGIRNVIEVRRERRILDALDCPYIMRIHASFQTDSRVYLLLDYLPGGELLMHTQRAPQHHFNEECSRFFIAELAIAVEHLRRHGILHRDIKGDNLVLDEGGHVVLSDFGFAKKVTVPISDEAAAATLETDRVLYLIGPGGEKLAQKVVPQHTSCGTLAYIAPEILHSARKARGYGLEVDWWSTGVVLFTVMTGYFPFLKAHHHETSNAIVNNPLQFPPRSNISEAAQNLLQRLIEKDPTRRISSLAQLKQHYFFHGFDWEACEQRRMRPPVLLHKDTYRKAISISTATERLRQRVLTTLRVTHDRTAEGNVQSELADDDNICLSASAASPASTHKDGAASAIPVPSNKRYADEFAEELRELRLVQLAYGADAAPEPTSYENDVFGDLFERQEECGSDRGQDDDTNLEREINTEYIPSATLLPTRQAVTASPLHTAAAASRLGGPGALLLPHSAVASALSCNNNYHVVGNASLSAAHEGGNGGGSHCSGVASYALCEFADGLEPVAEDFNEMAYASTSNIRHVCATEASLADTSLYRPVCEL